MCVCSDLCVLTGGVCVCGFVYVHLRAYVINFFSCQYEPHMVKRNYAAAMPKYSIETLSDIHLAVALWQEPSNFSIFRVCVVSMCYKCTFFPPHTRTRVTSSLGVDPMATYWPSYSCAYAEGPLCTRVPCKNRHILQRYILAISVAFWQYPRRTPDTTKQHKSVYCTIDPAS